MDIAQLRTDETKSQQGKWIDFDEGVSFLIAASNNPNHSKAMAKVAKKRARAARRTDAAESERLFVESLPGTVLLDWKGLESEGKPWPFTIENAALLLKQSTAVKDFVMVEAANHENFLVTQEEAATGDLKSPAAVGN